MAGVDIPAHMQGRAFLSEQKEEPRNYVVAHRDRFDESYDMMRSVRDKKYRYVRNYYTNQPYVQWIPYRNNSPIMEELLRLHADDKLEGAQKLWFRNMRPAEELYDCDVDPFHINNLADDPKYKQIVNNMSEILDNWRRETNDLGDIPESELKRRWWPDGKKPKTSRPYFVPNAESNRAKKKIDSEFAEFKYPAMIYFHCATQGASMAYTTEENESAHWKIVNGPIRLPKGKTLLRARAIRYGYYESDETRCTFTVK